MKRLIEDWVLRGVMVSFMFLLLGVLFSFMQGGLFWLIWLAMWVGVISFAVLFLTFTMGLGSAVTIIALMVCLVPMMWVIPKKIS